MESMGENSLHDSVKLWYARSGDLVEEEVDGYVVDIVRGDLLIEVQTGNFSALRQKLSDLIRRHPVRLVHPVPERKWIVRVDRDLESVLSRRRSPKRGRLEELFQELVYIPRLIMDLNFSVEVLLVDSEDVLVDDGRGSWRRRRWSIYDRRLLEVKDRKLFNDPGDLRSLLPEALPEEFTTKELVAASGIRPVLARKMAYCLRNMEEIDVVGRRGRSVLYRNPL
ncbi:MAG: hypothetical protein JSV27_09435 [Candidatus Bathyarchaeota archaeon]|nr:MAG: hypothetical protein JSV27_09435 [Candidatus Bathyarchaeota archaeon]